MLDKLHLCLIYSSISHQYSRQDIQRELGSSEKSRIWLFRQKKLTNLSVSRSWNIAPKLFLLRNEDGHIWSTNAENTADKFLHAQAFFSHILPVAKIRFVP